MLIAMMMGLQIAKADTDQCNVRVWVSDPDPKGLNVRAEPKAKSKVLGTLPNSTEITLVSSKNGWFRFTKPVAFTPREGRLGAASRDLKRMGAREHVPPRCACAGIMNGERTSSRFTQSQIGTNGAKTLGWTGQSGQRYRCCSEAVRVQWWLVKNDRRGYKVSETGWVPPIINARTR